MIRREKPWGEEITWAQTEHYVGKKLIVKKGKRLSRQYHEQKHETIKLISGQIIIEVGTPGEDDFHYVILNSEFDKSFVCPPGTVHRICAVIDSVLDEVSTPELDDVVRLEDDYGR